MKEYLKNLAVQGGGVFTQFISMLQRFAGNPYQSITILLAAIVTYDMVILGQFGIIKFILSTLQQFMTIIKDGGPLNLLIIILIAVILEKRK